MKKFINYLSFVIMLFLISCNGIVNPPINCENGYDNLNVHNLDVLEVSVSNGVWSVSKERIYDVFGGNVTVKFNGFTDADTTDYISQVSILGWNGSNWITMQIYTGWDYINGYHNNSYANEFTKFKIYIRLWTDEPTLDKATLRLTDLEVY